MTEKNIVILRIETGNPSGVVRYIQMLTEGMRHINGIKVHIICLNTSLIFPELEGWIWDISNYPILHHF